MSTSKSKKKMPKLSVDEQMKKDLDNTKFLADWGFTGPNPNNCHRCGIHNSMIDGYMIQCAKCKLVYYCSMKCFNVDLEAHRQFCDSGMLQSDVERVKLFDLPKTSAEDSNSKEQAASYQTQSPKSPKTPRLLVKPKSSLNASPPAQNDKLPTKLGKKKASPKKNTKVKVAPKKPLKAKPSDCIGSVDDAANTKICAISVPFTEDGVEGDSISGEGLSLSVDRFDTEPAGVESIGRTMIPETLVLRGDGEESASLVESTHLSTRNAECTSQSLTYPVRESNTESHEMNATSEVEMEPSPNDIQPSPIELLPTPRIATTSNKDESATPAVLPIALLEEEINVSTIRDADTKEIDAIASPQASREPSIHETFDGQEPKGLNQVNLTKGCNEKTDDDESSSDGAELSPLRSSRVWSEDEDQVSGDCQARLQRPPSLDMSTSSASDASVVSEATDREETDRLPGKGWEEECDGSDSTIIEYEEVLIEVQTCRASGSADITSECHEDESGSTENGGGGSGFSANHVSTPLVAENTDQMVSTNEMANSRAEETLDEVDGSNSTIVEYEEVIIEEDAYRASGSKAVTEEVSCPDPSAGSEASKVCGTSSLDPEPSPDANVAARQSLESGCESSPTCDDLDLSRLPTSLPAQASTYAPSEADFPTGEHEARRPLRPRESVATHSSRDDEQSVLSDDESTGSDTTIIEYEEVIIDEEWWGVSGNVNCFDGIVYELSEEVVRRKSGSVNVAENSANEHEEAPSGKVRRFRLEGPTSTGRFFLRPVERESDFDELTSGVDEDHGVINDAPPNTDSVQSDAHDGPDGVGKRGRVSRGAPEDHFGGSSRKLRVGEGSCIDEQKHFVPEVVDLKPVTPRSRPEKDLNDSADHRIALRPTPPSPKQVPPERDPSFMSKRSSLKEASRRQPKSPTEMRDYSFIKKRSNLKETSLPPKKNLRPGGEHYLVFDKERKAYILRSLTGAKDVADARDVVVLRPVKPAPKRQFEFEKPEWVKKSPIRNRGSLEGLLGQSFGNLGRSVADLNHEEPPSPRTPSRHEDCGDDQSLGSLQELETGSTHADRSMDQSGETIHMLEDGAHDEVRRPCSGRVVAGSRHAAQSNVVLRSSPNSPGSKKVESKLPSWAIKSPLRTTERGLMMKSFSDLSKLGNASFSTMPSSDQAFTKPSRKSSAAYKYVSPHRYKGDYMNDMATMIEASYETNEGDATDCNTLRSMPEL